MVRDLHVLSWALSFHWLQGTCNERIREHPIPAVLYLMLVTKTQVKHPTGCYKQYRHFYLFHIEYEVQWTLFLTERTFRVFMAMFFIHFFVAYVLTCLLFNIISSIVVNIDRFIWLGLHLRLGGNINMQLSSLADSMAHECNPYK